MASLIVFVASLLSFDSVGAGAEGGSRGHSRAPRATSMSKECPSLGALENGAYVEFQRPFSLDRKMEVRESQGNTSLMIISPVTFTMKRELRLHQPDGSFVAKLVSPLFDVSPKAVMIDCAGKEIAEIRWQSFRSTAGVQTYLRNPYLHEARLFSSHDGAHIADIESTQVADWFALSKDGKRLIEFRMEELSGIEKLLGIFGGFSKARITFMPGFMPPPYLLVDPRFLTLLAAAHLAPGGLFIPLLVASAFLCLCCLCCCCCICRGCRKSRSVHYAELGTDDSLGKAVGSKSSRDVRLVSPADGKQAGFLSAECCRRPAPVASNPIPKRKVSKRF